MIRKRIKNKDKKEIEMVEEKIYYILGKVFHQDDTSPMELLGDAGTTSDASDRISNIMNQSFPPKNIFVIEGIKREINIKSVLIK